MTINLRYDTSVAFVFTDSDYPERILYVNRPPAPTSYLGTSGTPANPLVIDVTQYVVSTPFFLRIPSLVAVDTRWAVVGAGIPDLTGIVTSTDMANGYIVVDLPLLQGNTYELDAYFEIPSPYNETVLLHGVAGVFEIIVDGPGRLGTDSSFRITDDNSYRVVVEALEDKITAGYFRATTDGSVRVLADGSYRFSK